VNRTLRLFAALGMLALPAVAQAQTSITGSITATADIATVWSWGTVTALNFGSVVPGAVANATGSIALSRNVGVIYSLPDGANTGKLTSTAGGTIMPTFLCGVGSTATTIVTSFSSCNGTGSVLTIAAPAGTVNEFVIFQGSLSAAQTNTVPGTYSGTIRITATPN
jgi:spore coat protein U-like protein